MWLLVVHEAEIKWGVARVSGVDAGDREPAQ
jgi:hypothetical protein